MWTFIVFNQVSTYEPKETKTSDSDRGQREIWYSGERFSQLQVKKERRGTGKDALPPESACEEPARRLN